jgi:sirohydrochlorin ferrochelatase
LNWSLLIIAHGSRSQKWNAAVTDLVGEIGCLNQESRQFHRVAGCFLEYGSPSIPEAVQSLSVEAVDGVLVLPLFLTVSHHVLLDIPAQLAKAAEPDALRHPELYHCQGKPVVLLTPLPVPRLLARNLVHRMRRFDLPASPGLIVVYYGTQNYIADWERLARYVHEKLTHDLPGVTLDWAYGGEAVGFAPDPLAKKIQAMAVRTAVVCILPALVAQGVIQATVIPQAIEKARVGDRVLYQSDAILPDPLLAADCLAEVLVQRERWSREFS